MYRLFYWVLGAAALAEFFSTGAQGSGFHLLPAPVKFLPDMLSVIFAVYVIGAGVRTKFQAVPVKYLLVFGALSVIIICGILANNVAAGPIVAGMRYYLRGIPFFFLPAVMAVPEWKLRRYLYFVLGISFLQVPFAIYERYHLESTGHETGDGVIGTLGDSGGLSLYLICVMCVLAAAMLRGRISKTAFFV